jgi:glutamate-1-semialdehyde 2,1-aminomutase
VNYQQRLNRVIPGGAHTYSRGLDQFPSNAPQILERGEGAYVYDPDGRRYLDYGMALRAVTLGYSEPRVNAAAWRQIERGNNLTRASTIELEAAELLTGLIPSAEMVKFAKNGSNTTTAAAKLARAYTGRTFICVPRQHPFFSFDDWFIGTTPMVRGIPDSHVSTTLRFDYGDIGSLETLFERYAGQIAGVMLEPATTSVPCAASCGHRLTYEAPCTDCRAAGVDFLQLVQALCRDCGALFILDEMITGFRWHLQGAQTYFGVEPDLSTFGKGMANGFSVAAVAGRRDVMQVGSIDTPGAERTFVLSTTHGAEMCGLGAFVETVALYRERDVCAHLWRYGGTLREGLCAVADRHGLTDHFRIDGPDVGLAYVLLDSAGEPSMPLRTLFAQEMVAAGVLMPWIAVSRAHGQEELDLTLEAADRAFQVVARAVEDGVEPFLTGPVVKPVFRRFN